jgi:hypothetical protein
MEEVGNMALTDQVTAIKAILANVPLPTLIDAIYLTRTQGGAVVNSSGTITIGGTGLTNDDYFKLGEALGIVW